MKERDKTDNVIPFPGAEHLGEESLPDAETSSFQSEDYTGCRYDPKEPSFDDYLGAEMDVAMHIQCAFGPEEANAWVRFHRSLSVSEPHDEPGDNDDQQN